MVKTLQGQINMTDAPPCPSLKAPQSPAPRARPVPSLGDGRLNADVKLHLLEHVPATLSFLSTPVCSCNGSGRSRGRACECGGCRHRRGASKTAIGCTEATFLKGTALAWHRVRIARR